MCAFLTHPPVAVAAAADTEFGARLTIDEVIQVETDALAEYLRDPAELLGAAWPKNKIRQLSDGCVCPMLRAATQRRVKGGETCLCALCAFSFPAVGPFG